MAFTEIDKMPKILLDKAEANFRGRYEEMNAEDISKFYYVFTKNDFAADGMFYKYIQKAATKLMKTFEGPHLRLMFYKFDEEEKTRLNVGVRGRLMDRVTELMKEEKIKGYDVNEIYNHTKKLTPNRPEKAQHDFNYAC